MSTKVQWTFLEIDIIPDDIEIVNPSSPTTGSYKCHNVLNFEVSHRRVLSTHIHRLDVLVVCWPATCWKEVSCDTGILCKQEATQAYSNLMLNINIFIIKGCFPSFDGGKTNTKPLGSWDQALIFLLFAESRKVLVAGVRGREYWVVGVSRRE